MPQAIQVKHYTTWGPNHMLGIRRYHDFASIRQQLPLQWQDFVQLMPQIDAIGPYTYGLICGHDATGMEYMCGVEVPSFENTQPELGRMRLGLQNYAVFEYQGPAAGIAEFWKAIMEEWVPTCLDNQAHVPPFERYGPDFDPQSSSGIVEIWMPIHRIPEQAV